MNTNVTMIPVAQLHPHPDNPRKDLGDITELIASIKANGVLQNLTVVPRANPNVNYEELCRQYYADPTEENRTKLNQFRNTDGYTVIIGHRRLAAAKAAGLTELLEQYKYTYEQMSDMLRRSPGAIQRRCADLGLKARPVRINPHGPEAVWHQEDYDRLAEGIKSGESYMSIGKALGKSEKAIRGKVYYCYLTENADKVRAMMAGGNWGDGAPEPTVWQARLLSRSRAEMQTTMTMLVEALNCRIQQVGYDPALEDHWNQYWQRTTCLHWDDLKHCTAGCTDCDSCAEYKKIPPQYCARCGATFYERKENTFCLQCRFDRKKQAQRHWCRVNAKRGERP